MSSRYFDTYRIKEHFKRNAFYYVLLAIFLLVGLGVGIYISITGYRYTALLSTADKNMFSYITGDAPYTSIFYSRLINVLLCVVIIVVLNLTIYTSFIGYVFMGYQAALMVLSSAAVITMYGLPGILNVVLFILPVNIANILIMSMLLVTGTERAKLQSSYKLKFAESFKENNYFMRLLIFVAALFVLCLFHSFILPLLIKSFVVINF